MSTAAGKAQKLISICHATGMSTEKEALLMLAYRGVGIQYDPKSESGYLTVSTAIEWNKSEALEASGAEKMFRLALIGELSLIHPDQEAFKYSDELNALRKSIYK